LSLPAGSCSRAWLRGRIEDGVAIFELNLLELLLLHEPVDLEVVFR